MTCLPQIIINALVLDIVILLNLPISLCVQVSISLCFCMKCMNTEVKCCLLSSIELWNLTGTVGTLQQPLGKKPKAVTLLYWGSDSQI